MKITLNNRTEEFDKEHITVTEMLNIKKFTYRMRLVKINSKLIKREDYDNAVIRDGDDVQMLYLMSGG
ncbi:MAG TPA: thiamine biosynthesis protein ThiS [Bacteroidales bacterium]|nr:thiamine biosynthesis protein ThiS [Bacteroidales bacterium]